MENRNPFWGARIKTERARSHISELEIKVKEYLDDEPVVPVRYEKVSRTKVEILHRLVPRRPIPGEFSAIFGDAVHNLRVALDVTANDAVELDGATPKNVYFPFSNSKSELDGQIKRRMRWAKPDTKEIVRNLKPYRGGNLRLRALHDLDIQDKHICALELSVLWTSPPMQVVSMHAPFVNGAHNCFPVPDDILEKLEEPEDGFKLLGVPRGSQFSIDIRKDLPLGKQPVTVVLNELADLVESVVRTFEAHFHCR